MNQFRFIHISQDVFDFVAGVANDAARFIGTVIDQATGDVRAAFVENGNDRAALEFAADAGGTDGKQALAFLAQGAHRPGIQRDSAAHLQMVGEPEVGRVVAREIVAVRQGEGFKRRHSEELDTHIFEIPYRP